MKKICAVIGSLLLAGSMLFAAGNKNAGSLVVYGSCEEEYVSAVCAKFEKLTGIKTSYQRLSTGEVLTKIAEENGKPSADVWFGGTTDPYNEAAAKGLLLPYDAKNAKHIKNLSKINKNLIRNTQQTTSSIIVQSLKSVDKFFCSP